MIFITGGVRSGKSAYAEQRALALGDEKHYYYFATGAAFDEEMKKRIIRHQQDRMQQEINWTTVEMQVEIPQQINQVSSNDVVLFECVTTWLSNVLYLSEQQKNRSEYINNCIESLQKQLQNWQVQGATIIVVSNEVLDELPSKYEEVNLYRKLLGNLHQWLVQHSHEAYEVQFQLVQRWK
ncbi:bifunctional adenosylcobinamide kinase/adenosylcobinamide-phosphate guanylyltransferase [Solibacillus sp. MA9]|uniref:Adenosylcobinamide kinase n=1 Tax=Solibacillus palustris TaxID=2908203 RepID=A0ABS9U9W2_9BACL|nr:bifunctional adenosylcobinamide kinase/adenosylcobinamide-phosphate guanylyltransferase [Solibacillus sp. MA9]MCH7321116.1 bifunctional adenosylcobinamide kinase/adenosylcobinamide-phosphate guanylyltransferase [Solibacillus sp. MA9]